MGYPLAATLLPVNPFLALALVIGTVAISYSASKNNPYYISTDTARPRPKNRTKSDRRKDPNSSESEQLTISPGRSSDEEDDPRKERNTNRIKGTSSHIFDRFVRYLRLIGMLQRIMEEENIERSQILVNCSRSHYQDRHSGQGSGVHAAHVIVAFMVNKQISNMELVNFLGHTQIVRREVNVGRIGRAIDNFQKNMLEETYNIDFSQGLTPAVGRILTRLRDEFIKVLINRNIGNITISSEDINEVISRINALTLQDMYDIVLEGYEGRHSDAYC